MQIQFSKTAIHAYILCRPPVKKNPNEASVPHNQEVPPDQNLTKEEAENILKKLWNALENPDDIPETADQFFSDIGMDQCAFEKASCKLIKTTIVLKQKPTDIWVNQYNNDLLRCWNANMDIQYITDAYSCVVYIISYISKAEREMGLLLDQARKEALDRNKSAKGVMKKLGSVYLHNREVSAQEAVFRVYNLKLKECSRKVQFIPVGENPIRTTKPIAIL